jgi:hypothetical protein
MPVLLTTIDRVKRRGAFSEKETNDTLLNELIAEVSADAEEFMGRHVWQTERTEVYRVSLHQHMLSLKGSPIVSVTSVKYARSRDFTGVSALDTANYNADLELGMIEFRENMPFAPGYVEVVYEGGMVAAATEAVVPAAFIAAHPDLAGALDQEIVERVRRMRNPSGSVMTKHGMTQQQRDLMLLRDVKRRLARHKRRRWQ